MSRLHRHTEALLRIETILHHKVYDKDVALLRDYIQREINTAFQDDKL